MCVCVGWGGGGGGGGANFTFFSSKKTPVYNGGKIISDIAALILATSVILVHQVASYKRRKFV